MADIIIYINEEKCEHMINKSRKGLDRLRKCVQAETLDAGLELVNDSEGRFTVSNYLRSGYSFVSDSCERPATQSRKLRQAIAYCFDRDALVPSWAPA